MELGLSYDDVLLIPQRSPVRSRRDVSLSTRVTKKLHVRIPIVSANMDTVTEADMAIAMAQQGGLGVIHRFNTVEQQVKEVQRVKRYRNAVVEHPFTVKVGALWKDAKAIMQHENITSLLVVDEVMQLKGILTSRDVRFKPDVETPVAQLMTPKEQLVVGHPGMEIDQAKQMLLKYKVEKLPLVNPDGTLAGLITGKDIHRKTQDPHATLDEKHRLCVGAAIGVKEEALERAGALVQAGVDVLVIDIAHGHADIAIETVKKIKEQYPLVEVIAGNVATPEAIRDLAEAGADGIKIGVGPGSICTTRIMTGSGYPQLSAVMNCFEEAKKYDIPLMADGGIKVPGDITKAIAAGASTVMLGSLLAGTEESPGNPIIKQGKKFKVVRGMASFGAKFGREKNEHQAKNFEAVLDFVPEGVEATIPYRGVTKEVLHQLLGGLRSGMSYCGVTTITDLIGKKNFVRITAAGMRESHAHDVNIT